MLFHNCDGVADKGMHEVSFIVWTSWWRGCNQNILSPMTGQEVACPLTDPGGGSS